jgi:HlyD family secretion protein
MCDLANGRLSHRRNLEQKTRRPFLHLITKSATHAVLFATVAALGIFLTACSGKKAAEAAPVVTVKAASVERKAIQQDISAEAVLYPLHQASIVPKISAPVAKFYVNRGDRVRAGQMLAVLENSDLQAAVAENKGTYQQAEANFESLKAANLPEQIQTAKLDVKGAQAAFDAAQQVYSSSEKLYQQGALAKKQLDQDKVAVTQAKNQLQTAEQHLAKLQSVGEKAQLKAAEGQLAAAKGRYENAQAQLAYTEIRSPITGVVTDRPLYPGEMASTSTPLITVMDISKVIARAHIPESQAGLLKAGDAATISASEESKGVPGKVIVVSPALDPGSTTVQVWVESSNPGDQLKPGSTVNLNLVAKRVAGALVIPKTALVADPDQGAYVMVIGPDGRAHQTKVDTGIEQDGEVQILKGLLPGQRLVTEGAYGLPDDTKVKY